MDLKTFFELSGFEFFQPDTNLPVWTLLEQMDLIFNRWDQYKISTEIPSGAFLENRESIYIAEGAIVEPGAFIRGPCLIGPYATIRFGAYIRGHVMIGSHSIVGHATEIKHSLVLQRSHLAHFNYVGDTIIGSDVNVGAHATFANLRLDRKPILPMEKEKFGAIVGDGVSIACHRMINPGTVIQKREILYPL